MEGDSLVVEVPILYEDNHLLVIEKPAGMLSQGDLSGDLDVLTVLKQLIKTRDNKSGNVFLGLVHRLDRPVGGTMVIAKTSKAAGRLSTQFRERTTTKIYHAVVTGTPVEKEATVIHHLVKDRQHRITRIAKHGKHAELKYRVVDAMPDRSLLEVILLTGLSHQIRAQLSALGHPILGDHKYGATIPYRKGSIALFATHLSFSHPTKKTPVEIDVELPSRWPFTS